MFRRGFFLGEMTADCPLLAREGGEPDIFGASLRLSPQLADLRELPLGRRGIPHGAVIQTRQPGNGVG